LTIIYESEILLVAQCYESWLKKRTAIHLSVAAISVQQYIFSDKTKYKVVLFFSASTDDYLLAGT